MSKNQTTKAALRNSLLKNAVEKLRRDAVGRVSKSNKRPS